MELCNIPSFTMYWILIVVKAEYDISLAKARAEVRKMNKRFIARTVEVLSHTLVTDMEIGLQNIVS